MRRALLGIAGLVLVLGIVIHLPPVMHWLGAHGHHGAGVCPLGYGKARAVSLAPPKPGVARPALGFQLGVTTAPEIERWGLLHGIQCVEKRGSVVCKNIASALLGDIAAPPAAIQFSLDAAGHVLSLQVTRRGPEVASIASAFDRLTQEMTAARGAPTKQSGSAAPSELSRGALRQAMVEYKRDDYRAVLRATNMGDGFVLTEQYSLM